MIKVNRAIPWKDLSPHFYFYESQLENPKAQKILNFEASDIELLPLSHDEKALVQELLDYEDQGYILLDAAIAFSLMDAPAQMPRNWERIADCDSLEEGAASIRFDGSVFLTGESSKIQHVLTPFTSRGHWTFGLMRRFPEPQKGFVRNGLLTAVIHESKMIKS